MSTIGWILIAYLTGALPLSLWIGRFALHTDIRQYGDGNPGATNVFRAGGKGWGALALLLDIFKGAIPVWIVVYGVGIEGWGLTAVALAPILGHAFSPFLHCRGGKALAVSLGVWTGLTLYQVPIVAGLACAVGLLLFTSEGWAVMVGMVVVLLFLLLTGADSSLLGVWLGNTAILIWTHRGDLKQKPVLRPLRD